MVGRRDFAQYDATAPRYPTPQRTEEQQATRKMLEIEPRLFAEGMLERCMRLFAAMATVVTGWAPAAPGLSPPVCRLHRRASQVIAAAPTVIAGPRLLYCDGLSKSYDGKRYQFRDISLGVAAGQRAGLIGVNGVGKSTLLKCLAGLEEADAGSVGVEGRPVVLYVEQEPARGQDSAGGATWTVADALTEPMVAGASASTPAAAKTAAALRAVRAYWAANAAQEAQSEEAEAKMVSAMDLMGSAEGSWELDQQLIEISARLDVGASAFRQRPVASLSGGERKRVALAAALAQVRTLMAPDCARGGDQRSPDGT